MQQMNTSAPLFGLLGVLIGAFIGLIATFLTLRQNRKLEEDKRKHEDKVRHDSERAKAYSGYMETVYKLTARNPRNVEDQLQELVRFYFLTYVLGTEPVREEAIKIYSAVREHLGVRDESSTPKGATEVAYQVRGELMKEFRIKAQEELGIPSGASLSEGNSEEAQGE